jgi:imidazolonepropionase-like amidohydrolase
VLPYAIADMAEFLGNAGALSAATCHAAAACNLADRKARLAPGFDADILAVEGNPSPTSTPSTAASPCSTGDACHQQPTGHA